jgi:formate hydrogenlyase transcriptional activator
MEAVATGKPHENEVRSRRSDGQYRWQLDRGVPLRDEDGNIVKWYGVTTDIEDRKRAEEARGRNEFYLSEGQRLAHMGSWGFNPAGFYDYWSEELFRIYDLDPDKGPPTLEQYLACVHPQDRAFMAESIRTIVAGGLGCDLKKRLVRPDGELRYIRCVGIPVIENGVLKRIIGTAMDVTEQERLTQELQRREAYLAEAQRLSHTGSFGWRVSSGEIFWSDETFRIFQYDPSTKPTVELVLSRVHPEDRDPVQQQIERAARDGEGFDLEHRLRLPDGSIKHVHVTAHPSRDGSGNFEFVGAITDVSEHRQAEAMIRERQRELQQILDLAPQHIGVLGPDGRPLYANRATLEYLGVDIDRWRDETARYSLVHPDDRERFLGERKRRFLEGAPHEFEVRLLGHNGKFRWFLFHLNPLKDEWGQITRWYGTAIDIEDRKQAEDILRRENVALREEIDKASMFEEIVGTSPALQTVLSRISKVARSDSTVLITGETGTGKELVARAIHRRSNRASRAFVSVNCAAIPRDLIASELFGHEKGAFTGATQQRLGRFELANGGTLFLDEVGELPPETQIALLRVLQEHEFERVGGTRQIRVDVRVIAATNRDLQAAISAGSFRSDLFYRLHVFPIEIPALRERREDIPLLVEYFIDRYARKAGKHITTVEKRTLQVLQSYPWPGNIRELQNVIERSVIVCETENFSVDESWLSRQPVASEPASRLELSRKFVAQEKEMIEAALRESRGRVSGSSGAAAKLGIPGSTLESKIRSLKINKNRFKTNPSADRT